MRQHISFAAVALLFGTAYALITPPFEVPDEVGHYWRASSIAYGFVGSGRPSMPRGFRILVWALYKPQRNVHLTIEKLRLARGVQLESDVRVPLRAPAYYSPAAYLPQIIAALMTRVAAALPFFGFYAGRLATLLASIMLVTLAGAIAPEFRDHFHAVALLPMSLFLFASWSADAMTIVVAFLTSGLLLHAMIFRGAITRGEMVATLCASLWLALCKPSYLLITVLGLLIPKSRFRATARYALFAALLVVAVAGAAALSVRLAMSAVNEVPRHDVPIDPRAQVQFIRDDPLRFAEILFRDVRISAGDYFKAMTGRFGLYDVSLPLGVTLVLLAMLVAVALLNGESLAATVRATILCVVTVIFLGMLTFFYITWSTAGGSNIEGVQGRYLLPILPLLMTACRIPCIDARLPHAVILIVAAAMNIVSLAVLVQRYW